MKYSNPSEVSMCICRLGRWAVLASSCACAGGQQLSGVPGSGAPIAVVTLDPGAGDAGATVTGALQVTGDKAMIGASGTITAGTKTAEVKLPRRGTLRVCASTSVKLAADASVPAGETPGLIMAIDKGAVETSFAIGSNSDILMTPDFRILLGGPGASEVKVRLGQHGDTCVDNPGDHAPYVVVSSVFDGGAYRVQPGQRVMFQHGNLHEVVDQEKEPCGCPPEEHAGTNEFPLAQSAGLAPMPKPLPAPVATQPAPPEPVKADPAPPIQPLVYSAPREEKAPAPVDAPPVPPASTRPIAQASPVPAAPAEAHQRSGFFHTIGHFFRRIFGAE